MATALAAHNDWLTALRADYDRRTSEATAAAPRFSTGSQDEAAFAHAAAPAAEHHYPSYGGMPSYGGHYAGAAFDEGYDEGPVYRSLGANLAAMSVAEEEVERPVYRGMGAGMCGAVDYGNVESASEDSAMAVEAAWLASNPPLLQRQAARSDFADPSGWRPNLMFERS